MRQAKNTTVMITYCLMGTTAILITLFGIFFQQKFLNMLPLYISLIIGMLQSRANRFAPLLGGFNSILYAAVYTSFTLYANAAYALLVSAPLQLITFFNWRRRKQGNTTKFRKMRGNMRLLVLFGLVLAWIACYFILSLFGSDYMLLDNTVSLIGILATVLMLFSFVEYAPMTLLGCLISLVLYITMIRENPAQTTYLIFTVYSCICNTMAVFAVKQHYTAQSVCADQKEND